MKKRIAKIVLCVMVLVIALSSIGLLVGCGTKKKAIIILPGIMGSGFVEETADGVKALWDPFGGKIPNISMDDIPKLIKDPAISEILNGLETEESFFIRMGCNEEGVPNRDNVRNSNFFTDDILQYGALSYYKDMYESLNAKYGKKYDVFVFNFDWRLSNVVAAQGLETLINQRGYESVVLLAHSMGGVVGSCYAALSEANASKIDMMVTYGTPFYGAPMGFCVEADPFSYLGVDTMPDVVQTIATKYEAQLRNLVANFTGIYELFPYPELFDMKEYGKDAAPFTIEGSLLNDYNEYLQTMENLPFNLKADGSKKTFIKTMLETQKLVFKDVNGVKTHISKTINTKYLVGTGVDTGATYEINNNKATQKTVADGDGTVLYYSASCGLPLDDKNVITVPGVSHGPLCNDFSNTTKDITFKLLDELK
ncbi:MAG: hypothetical protein RR454_03210 [Clostridia bacterium]